MMSSQRNRKEPAVSSPCETCRVMTSTRQGLKALVSPEGYEHLSYEGLTESGLGGCMLCSILRSCRRAGGGNCQIRAIFQPTGSHGEDSDAGDEETTHPFNGRKVMFFRVTFPEYPFSAELKSFTTSDDPAAMFFDVPPIAVMNEAIVEHAKTRIHTCQNTHEHCPATKTTPLPKRVVDVGTDNPEAPLHIHLSGVNETAPYTALSYCWGGSQDIVTTSATLQSYTVSLPEALPQTIQDAITVTRRLDIRYLWIDALCIIQDDQADKANEISAMGLVYKNATVTIAAASAETVNHGFLGDRAPFKACRLPIFVSDTKYGIICVQNHQKYTASIEPLESRAWAFQESLLSPRVLYFGTLGLMWKCQTDEFVTVEGTADPYHAVYNERLPTQVFIPSQGGTDMITLDKQAEIWHQVVENYSRRKLSDLEDRLPALAGIASELQKLWDDQYIAGMWRRCLVRHLGWYPSHPSGEVIRQEVSYTSPGWSWATRHTEVFVCLLHYEAAKVLDVSVTLLNKTYPLGPVGGGRLVLRAPVLPGDVDVPPHICHMDDGADWNRDMYPDMKFLLLGHIDLSFTPDGLYPVALVLSKLEDGTFMRVGIVRGSGGDFSWSSDWVKEEVVTIV